MRIDLSHSELFLRDDGIVQVNTTDHDYGMKELKEINIAQGQLNNGKRRLLLVIVSEFANIEKEGREYMATDESTQFSIVEAYVISSLAHKILGNFYMRMNKPSVPTRFFTEIKVAEEWLNTYRPSDL
ncbi:MAG: hypothetical protein KBG47_10780 [Bacteroidia bacterium]|nr:hypothetical protein [Sphingobacteriaceae bacterium]MBK7310928.1 hypothetical protein [Sphingobacteriaceae bacterium]MBP9069984.1 hypothetical protein [Bacteroidia bacterium]